MGLERLADLEFPQYPDSELQNSSVRTAYAKANAYITLALVEADIDHSRSDSAAAVTDATHSLIESDDPLEYLNHAHQELAHAIAETDSGRLERKLELIRKAIAEVEQQMEM